MKELISISGKLNHGKDTLVDLIIEAYSNKVTKQINSAKTKPQKMAFADPIKNALLEIFPQLTKKDLWGPSQNKNKIIEGYVNPETGKPLTIRNALTQVGAWGRACNIDCWGMSVLNKSKDLRELTPIIISDCRFRSEKKLIEEHGGKVIRIIRPEIGFTTLDPSEIDLDEVSLDNYSLVVINNNLEDLQNAAIKIVDEYFRIY